ACLQANTPHQRPHSPAGWLPQITLRSRCGSLPASEYPTSEAAFASRLAPTVCATKPLWELACKRIPQSEATFASRLAPTDYATKPLWELACKRIPHIRG